MSDQTPRATCRWSRWPALFEVDVRALAVLRVGLGAMLLVDLVQRARWIPENYGAQGLLPVETLAGPGALFPSLHVLAGSGAAQVGLFGLAGVFSVMLMVGFETRLATFVSWFLLVSLHARNPGLLDGGDRLLVWMLVWGCFLPLGATASVDARLRGRRVRGCVLSPASAGLLLQAAFLYFYAGITKSGAEWRDGTALEYVLQQSFWSRPVGEALLGFPELLSFLTHFTVVVEIAVGPLLFVPFCTAALRTVLLGMLVVLQLSFGLCIELNLFPFVSTLAVVPFVPSSVWDRLRRRLGSTRAKAADTGIPAGKPGRVASVVASVLLVVSVARGLVNLHPSLALPGPVSGVATALWLNQDWTLYSPRPGNTDYWITREGSRRGQEWVDLDSTGDGARWERVRAAHDDYRIKSHLETMRHWPQMQRDRYAAWLCDAYNASRTRDSAIGRVRVRFHERPISLRGGSSPASHDTVIETRCATATPTKKIPAGPDNPDRRGKEQTTTTNTNP